MKRSTRTAAVLAVAAVALAAAYGTAHAARHTLAPGQQRVAMTPPVAPTAAPPAVSPADEHDPEEDVGLDENGRPDTGEDRARADLRHTRTAGHLP
ncbi:hypothetical protein [Streptomyces sp. SCL15-4]|uniref:hypothetical protein n=1 Tax=Streptomyces sp. SCL15-4 TaxID=2967221 RepID=UPI0029673912|nr:hypothetical protein [Streptomyces sp. SCL15-4]